MRKVWAFLNSPIILVVTLCCGIALAGHHVASMRSFRVFVNPPPDKMTLTDAQRTTAVLEAISITNTSFSRDSLSGRAKVIGTIENRSSLPIAIKQMQVSLISSNGILLDVSDSYTGGMPFYPGRPQNFAIDTGLSEMEVEDSSPQIKIEIVELELIDE